MAARLYRVASCTPFAAAAALGCFLAFAARAQEPAAGCTVARISGTAVVLRDGGSSRLAPGASLGSDDQLVTGARARLRIACKDGVEITIGPDSSVAMRALATAGTESRSLIELVGGILRIALAPHFARDRLELRTPTAVAAARSTAWTAEADAGKTAVFVIEGTVSVSSRATGATAEVSAGFGIDVPATGAPAAPVRWGQPRAERALQLTAFP